LVFNLRKYITFKGISTLFARENDSLSERESLTMSPYNTCPLSLFLPHFFSSSINALPKDHLTQNEQQILKHLIQENKTKLHSNNMKPSNKMKPSNNFTMNPNTNARTRTDDPLVDGKWFWFCIGDSSQPGCGQRGFGNPTHCPYCHIPLGAAQG